MTTAIFSKPVALKSVCQIKTPAYITHRLNPSKCGGLNCTQDVLIYNKCIVKYCKV